MLVQELILVNNFKASFLILLILSCLNYHAWQDPSVALPLNSSSSLLSRAANCTPASGRKFLEYNNVSALIETGGSMWLDRSRGKNAYEVPKGSWRKTRTLSFSKTRLLGGSMFFNCRR